MERKALAIILAGILCVGIIGPAGAKKKKAGPVVVFEDPAGDSGHQSAGPIPGTEQGGFDLTKGTIQASGKNLIFNVEHSAMPPAGTIPETFRLLWHISVNGTEYRFTVKSFDIGKPDVLAGTGADRVGTVYASGTYRLEECKDEALPAVLTLINCSPVENGYLEGAFDPTKKSVSWTLPMALVKAKKGSLIAGGTTGAAASSCQICWVAHLAERSLTPHTILDNATQTVTYKVP